MEPADLPSAEHYTSRVVGLARIQPSAVLAQRLDEKVPLLERMNPFLCMLVEQSRPNSFFESSSCRARHNRASRARSDQLPGPHGLMTITEQCRRSTSRRRSLESQYRCLNGHTPAVLHHHGSKLLAARQLGHRTSRWLEQYFEREVERCYRRSDSTRHARSAHSDKEQLNFIVRLAGQDAFRARHEPRCRPGAAIAARVVELPAKIGTNAVLLTGIVQQFVSKLFSGWRCSGAPVSL